MAGESGGPLNPGGNCSDCELANVCRVWYGVQRPVYEARMLAAGNQQEKQPRAVFALSEHVLLLGVGETLGQWCSTYRKVK